MEKTNLDIDEIKSQIKNAARNLEIAVSEEQFLEAAKKANEILNQYREASKQSIGLEFAYSSLEDQIDESRNRIFSNNTQEQNAEAVEIASEKNEKSKLKKRIEETKGQIESAKTKEEQGEKVEENTTRKEENSVGKNKKAEKEKTEPTTQEPANSFYNQIWQKAQQQKADKETEYSKTISDMISEFKQIKLGKELRNASEEEKNKAEQALDNLLKRAKSLMEKLENENSNMERDTYLNIKYQIDGVKKSIEARIKNMKKKEEKKDQTKPEQSEDKAKIWIEKIESAQSSKEAEGLYDTINNENGISEKLKNDLKDKIVLKIISLRKKERKDSEIKQQNESPENSEKQKNNENEKEGRIKNEDLQKILDEAKDIFTKEKAKSWEYEKIYKEIDKTLKLCGKSESFDQNLIENLKSASEAAKVNYKNMQRDKKFLDTYREYERSRKEKEKLEVVKELKNIQHAEEVYRKIAEDQAEHKKEIEEKTKKYKEYIGNLKEGIKISREVEIDTIKEIYKKKKELSKLKKSKLYKEYVNALKESHKRELASELQNEIENVKSEIYSRTENIPETYKDVIEEFNKISQDIKDFQVKIDDARNIQKGNKKRIEEANEKYRNAINEIKEQSQQDKASKGQGIIKPNIFTRIRRKFFEWKEKKLDKKEDDEKIGFFEKIKYSLISNIEQKSDMDYTQIIELRKELGLEQDDDYINEQSEDEKEL